MFYQKITFKDLDELINYCQSKGLTIIQIIYMPIVPLANMTEKYILIYKYD